MSVTLTEGPAILIGYGYALQIEADAPLFEVGAELIADLRVTRHAPEALGRLSTAAGTLQRLSDRVLEIRIPPEITARLAEGTVHLDLVRHDLAPPRHLRVALELPVILPVTREDAP